jgi:adenylyltransferase/sulfurtransferase
VVPTCGEGGVFGVLPGTIGTIQATEVIKLILNIGEKSIGKLFLFDGLDMSLQSIQLRKNPKCKVCGESPEITTLEDTAFFCDAHNLEESFQTEWEWSVQDVKKAIDQGNKLRLIDVRDPVEREVVAIPQSENIPYERINNELIQNDDIPVVFYCRNGVRSARAARKLRNAGFDNVFNLAGGTNAWAREIDQEANLY